MTQPSPGWERLCKIMRFDEIDPDYGPPVFRLPRPPRAVPPVSADTASVERTAAWRRALARAVKRDT